MNCRCVVLLTIMFLVPFGAQAREQPVHPAVRSSVSTVSTFAQVLGSDVVVLGGIEKVGSSEELDVVMPLQGKSGKQQLQRLSVRPSMVMKDLVGGASPSSNGLMDILAPVVPTATNSIAPYSKGQQGVFLLNRLVGRSELLVSRCARPFDGPRYAAMARREDEVVWGQVTKGLQMAVVQLASVSMSTNGGAVRIGVAVKNASEAPVALRRDCGAHGLEVRLDNRVVRVSGEPLPSGAASNAVVSLLPRQVALLSPGGNPDSGFIVPIPSVTGGEWSVSAVYEPALPGDDASLWKGRLETPKLIVRSAGPLVRPPVRVGRQTSEVAASPPHAGEASPRPEAPPPDDAVPVVKPVLPLPLPLLR